MNDFFDQTIPQNTGPQLEPLKQVTLHFQCGQSTDVKYTQDYTVNSNDYVVDTVYQYLEDVDHFFYNRGRRFDGQRAVFKLNADSTASLESAPNIDLFQGLRWHDLDQFKRGPPKHTPDYIGPFPVQTVDMVSPLLKLQMP
jgi:hypothetical protein